MSWSECATASDFVQRRRSELLAHESRHCLAWGAVNRCQSAPKKVAITRFLIYTTGSISSAHALLTDHDQHLILSAMTDSEAGQLRDDLRRRQTTLLTIEGPAERAAQFVADWIEERGVKERTRMNQGLYELRTVSDMPSVAGAMVCATEDHLEHTERLMQGFIGSIGEQPIDAEHISERARRTVAERRAYLWQLPDRRIVSLSAIVRETPNTASISWVYTAPAARRNGYAAQLVAALSQAQLDRGKSACNLHTDLDNPTSNAIYRGIGYRLIARSLRVRLTA